MKQSALRLLKVNAVRSVLRGTNLFKLDIFRKHDLALMTICFVFINYFQKLFNQQAQPLPEGAVGIRNVRFLWPPVVAVH
jgi:hypothetical protein